MKETLRLVGLVACYFAVAFALPISLGGCTALRPYYPVATHFGECVAVCAGGAIAEAVKVKALTPALVTVTPTAPSVSK